MQGELFERRFGVVRRTWCELTGFALGMTSPFEAHADAVLGGFGGKYIVYGGAVIAPLPVLPRYRNPVSEPGGSVGTSSVTVPIRLPAGHAVGPREW